MRTDDELKSPLEPLLPLELEPEPESEELGVEILETLPV